MISKAEIGRAATLLVALIIAGMFLAGCVADTPRTYLDWGGVRETALGQANATPRDVVATRAPAETTDLVTPPAPRSKPAWYTASNLPAPTTAPVTRTLPPAVTYAATPTFSWPLTGQVISDFGSGGSGERNNGINIAAAEGTPIRASAAGTVSYAGNELRGYGNLVLIKHDDGYVTAYAHAERIVVQRGDTVSKGQVIAYAGSTGDVTTPQLHFEIRHGVQPVNPRTLLIASSSN